VKETRGVLAGETNEEEIRNSWKDSIEEGEWKAQEKKEKERRGSKRVEKKKRDERSQL